MSISVLGTQATGMPLLFGTPRAGDWQLGMCLTLPLHPFQRKGWASSCGVFPAGSGWTGKTRAHGPKWIKMATSNSTWPSPQRPTATLSSSTSPGTRVTAPSASTLSVTLVLTGQELGGTGGEEGEPLANI